MFFLKISWIKEGRTKRSRKRGPVERVLCLAIGSRLSAHGQLASPVANAGRLRGAAGRIYGAFLFTIRKVYDFHIFIAYFVAICTPL